MATQSISDAVVVPQDSGTGYERDTIDAAAVALLSEYQGGEYRNGLQITNRDASADTISIGSGYAFVRDDSSSTANSRSSSGSPQVQSTLSSGYDTSLPANPVYVVIVPSSTTVSVSDATLSQIWLNIVSVSNNNDVEIRSSSGGGTTAEPSDTYIKLAEANPDDSSQDVVYNDHPEPEITVEDSATEVSRNHTVDFAGGLSVVDNGDRLTVSNDSQGGTGSLYYNVLDEGAVGDGTTDDTAAVQSAVDKAVNNGGVVFFPGGNSYKIDSKVVIDGGINIKLSGYGAEIVGLPAHVFNIENSIKVTAEGFRYNPNDSSGTRTQFISAYNNSDIRLYNIDCVGRGALISCSPSSKLTSDSEADSHRVTIRDCKVEYDADTSTIENGINLYNVKNQYIDGYFYDQITAQDGDGIKINAPSTDPTQQVSISNSEIRNAKDDAIDFYGSRADRVTVENCKLVNSGTRGIKGRRADKVTVRSTEFDSNDLFFQETNTKIVVEDCVFKNIGGTQCLTTDDCPHTVVRDTQWVNCTVERPIESEISSGDQRLVVDSCSFDVDNTNERCVALRCLGGTSEVQRKTFRTIVQS